MSRIQDGVIPTKWSFQADPAFVWQDLGKEIVYVDDYVGGSSHVDGVSSAISGLPSKVNLLYEDLYNRLGYVKRLADISGNRGYSKNTVINATRALTIADSGLITVVTDAIGTPPTTPVILTLPSRSDLVAAGVAYFDKVPASPFLNVPGNGLPVFTINGYQTAAGVPLKISVPIRTSPGSPTAGDDFAQYVTIGLLQYQDIYLYSGEYAEIVPIIIHDVANDYWFGGYNIFVHRSGYGKVGAYAQNPIGILPTGQLKADNSSHTRANYPRLWAALTTGGELNGALVAQASKVNAKYGDGNGTTTFTLPDLTALSSALVDWCLQY